MFGITSSLGAISNFDHHTQDWKVYRNRLQQWFIANNIEDGTEKAGVKKKAVLLSALTESTYQLACNLALPDDLDTKNYQDILRLLDEHLTVKRCGFAERHKFYTAVQQTGESHSQWAARLRGLAVHCGFKDVEDYLLDRFVVGMLPGHERDKLFAQQIKELTLSKAVNLAESVRCAREGAAAAPSTGTVAGASQDAVFKITQRPNSKGSQDCSDVKCSVCGYKNHKTAQCRFSNYKCKGCNRKGHLRRMCPDKKVNYFEQGNTDDEGDDGESNIYIDSVTEVPMTDTVSLEGNLIECEFDSGSPVSVISEQIYNTLFSQVPLSAPTKKLYTYTSNKMDVVGSIKVNVSYLGRVIKLPIHVVRNGGPTLLGRDFMKSFNLRLVSTLDHNDSQHASYINNISENLAQMYPKVFSDDLGCLNKFEVKLPLKSDAKPVFFKSRTVPFALRDKVNNELDRLVELGILTPVTYSDYASPIVPVLKRDGSVRICADYSVTINKQLLVEKYPLPTAQELFAKLHGAEVFSKLDLSMAYNQLRIHGSSQKVTCINTSRGLFNYTRLIFGLSSAPAIFQRVIESIVGNIDGVLCFQDDILIAGDKDSHLSRLKEVLQRLQDAGLTLRKDKCSFFQKEVSYLGYILDNNGIRKNPLKVDAILRATVPKNVSELQSFLGLINYYRSFVPNASSILNPLHALLRKGTKWNWTADQENAFNIVKKCLASDNTLAHFDNNANIILTVDASPVGLGAILSQVGSDGVERPLSYASRSLIPAEKNYSQIQKEATAIIFGVKKYHQYLYGRSEPFTLRTDHKPLTTIFGKNRGIPEVSANRLQRYAIFLSAYNYNIEYIDSASNTADFLSRAIPVQSAGVVKARAVAGAGDFTRDDELAAYVNFAVEGCLPITTKDLKVETESDKILRTVTKYVLNGWPRKMSDPFIKPYFLCRHQISLENGILMRGHKVIIPEKLRESLLKELHSSHFGIIKMKAEARARMWFPGIDDALERLIGKCPVCTQLRPSPPRAALAPWPHPPHAFHRIHLDFLGPISNKMFLVVVDAYSKWVECYIMNNNITTKAVIAKMCDFMARFGTPNVIVSDNGTSFTSQEFKNFCVLNNISQLFSPVYHPMSNGQAESFVKIIKRGIKTFLLSGCKSDDLQLRLSKFLFDYRNSINNTTETSPAELVFGHKLRSRLDLITPVDTPSSSRLSQLVDRKQCLQAKQYGGKKYSNFKEGDLVYLKKFMNKNKYIWIKGQIKKKIGKVLYIVNLLDSDTVTEVVRHKNQIYQSKDDESKDKKSEHNWQVTLPQEEEADVNEAGAASSHAVPQAAAPSPSPAPAPALGSRPDGDNADPEASCGTIERGSTPPRSDPDVVVTAGRDNNMPSSSMQPECRTPEAMTPKSTTSSSPMFSTPQSDDPSVPSRPRRNKPPVDYKKYFKY